MRQLLVGQRACHSVGKKRLFNSWSQKTGVHTQQNDVGALPCGNTAITSKWIKALNLSANGIKVLKENMEDFFTTSDVTMIS